MLLVQGAWSARGMVSLPRCRLRRTVTPMSDDHAVLVLTEAGDVHAHFQRAGVGRVRLGDRSRNLAAIFFRKGVTDGNPNLGLPRAGNPVPSDLSCAQDECQLNKRQWGRADCMAVARPSARLAAGWATLPGWSVTPRGPSAGLGRAQPFDGFDPGAVRPRRERRPGKPALPTSLRPFRRCRLL